MAVRDRGVDKWARQGGSGAGGRDWARLSADRLVQRLRREIDALRARCATLESALAASAGGPLEPGSLLDRLLASAPALDAELRGVPVAGTRRLRRNTSWHAALTPQGGFVHAAARDLRAVQRGPRLGSAESTDARNPGGPQVFYIGDDPSETVQGHEGEPDPELSWRCPTVKAASSAEAERSPRGQGTPASLRSTALPFRPGLGCVPGEPVRHWRDVLPRKFGLLCFGPRLGPGLAIAARSSPWMPPAPEGAWQCTRLEAALCGQGSFTPDCPLPLNPPSPVP